MFRKQLIHKLVRQRFVVVLQGDEGAFSGVLIDADDRILVFDDNQTVPTTPDAVPSPYQGRFYVERANIKYLQEQL